MSVILLRQKFAGCLKELLVFVFRVHFFAAGVQLFKGTQILLLIDISELLELLTVLVLEVLGYAQELPIHYSVIQVGLQILHVHRFSLLGKTKESDGVADQFTLDFLIERAIRAEARTVINFEKVGLALVIEHDVEAEDLETH